MIAASLLKRLDFSTLRLLVAVDEEKTLTRAAQREAIAVSAASRRLADLEETLGLELFQRQTKGMMLTPAGETLLHHARRILFDIEKAGIELGEHAKGLRGYVRIVANLSAIMQFLPEDLERFLAKHDSIGIQLEECPSQKVVDGVRQGKAEFGICGTADSRGLEEAIYRRDRLVVAMRPDHPLAGMPGPLDFADTLDFDFIGLHVESSIFLDITQAARRHDRPLRLRIHVPSFDTVCRMVQTNMGIGIIPDGAFAVLGPPLGLIARPLADAWAHRELKLVHRGFDDMSPVARLLFEHLRLHVQTFAKDERSLANGDLP